MYLQFLSEKLEFPHPDEADSQGLLAVGGDLSTQRLLLAYRNGIFPWYSPDDPILWWSPDPRMVFDLHKEQPMKVSKSLRQSMRNKGFIITENQCFNDVMELCGAVLRGDQDGTWITEEMLYAYDQMHKLGHVHSIEVWQDGKLVGGLYGLDLSDQGVFCGESMFHTVPDASKVALAYAINKFKAAGYRYIDCQLPTDHLQSLGGVTLSRKQFLKHLNPSLDCNEDK